MRKHSLVAIASLLSACTVGKNYAGPAALPAPARPGAAFARGADAVSPDQPKLAQWWLALGDPVLNTLEARALAGNPRIDVARARIEQARQNVRYERAQELPTGALQGTYINADLPGLDLGSNNEGSGGTSGQPSPGQPPAASSSASTATTISFFNLGLNANWEIDLWGKQRRIAEAANAQLGSAVASEADAQVQLTAEVAQAYVNLRERQYRLASLERARQMRSTELDLAQQRYRQGTTAAFPVEQARTQLNAVSADIAGADA